MPVGAMPGNRKEKPSVWTEDIKSTDCVKRLGK